MNKASKVIKEEVYSKFIKPMVAQNINIDKIINWVGLLFSCEPYSNYIGTLGQIASELSELKDENKLFKLKQDIVIEQLVKEGYLLEFNSLEETREYFNVYDYQAFKTNDDLLEYCDTYLFKYKNKYYFIEYDEARADLEDWKILPSKEIIKGE